MSEVKTLNIIPEPNSVAMLCGGCFHLTRQTVFECEELQFAYREIFDDYDISKVKSKKCKLDKIVEKDSLNAENNTIKVLYDQNMSDEEYSVLCDNCDTMTVTARNNKGVFYALQTIRQIAYQCDFCLPFVSISDKPKYDYRAFMLDVGRYFYPVESVKRYIKLMSVLKLNVFHFHLTEDQGFRIEIKKYPLLTEKGSKRSHTNFNRIKHGGFYTQDQIRDIVEFCRVRKIEVVPEFDIPGHTLSLLACYPELGCFERKLKVGTHWGVKHDVMCAGKESTYQFCQDVIDEMLELFNTSKYFHIGGDEVFKARWEICPHCRAKMVEQNLQTTEHLQQYFMSRINQYLVSKGRSAIIWNWDDVHNVDHLDSDIIWQYCGMAEDDLTAQMVNKGLKVIVSTCYANYLDFPYAWANLEKTYKNLPELISVEKENLDNILGIEAPLWTEYVKNDKKADFLTFPRLVAVSEIAWSKVEDRDFDRFESKLPSMLDVLDMYDVGYAKKRSYQPSKVRAMVQSALFNRRVIHWQGLHNLIDDAWVKQKYGK